jgi:hypothetical protein
MAAVARASLLSDRASASDVDYVTKWRGDDAVFREANRKAMKVLTD